MKRINVVSILIDRIPPNREDDIANLQPGFRRRHVRVDASHVDTSRLAGLSGVTAQLRITRWKKTESGGGKPVIMLCFRIFQKMGDNWSGDCVEDLGPW